LLIIIQWRTIHVENLFFSRNILSLFNEFLLVKSSEYVNKQSIWPIAAADKPHIPSEWRHHRSPWPLRHEFARKKQTIASW
jgi:hypothetical protein